MDSSYGVPQTYSVDEEIFLREAYLEDPSDVPCPGCGHGFIEVLDYLDLDHKRRTSPDEEYTIVLYCNGCGRAAPLDLEQDAGPEKYEDEENEPWRAP